MSSPLGPPKNDNSAWQPEKPTSPRLVALKSEPGTSKYENLVRRNCRMKNELYCMFCSQSPWNHPDSKLLEHLNALTCYYRHPHHLGSVWVLQYTTPKRLPRFLKWWKCLLLYLHGNQGHDWVLWRVHKGTQWFNTLIPVHLHHCSLQTDLRCWQCCFQRDH